LECQRGNISICCQIIDAASAESPRILVFIFLLKIVEHWAFRRYIKVCDSCFSAVSLTCEPGVSIYLPLSNGLALKTDLRDFQSRIQEGTGWGLTTNLRERKARVERDAEIRQLEFESEKHILRFEYACRVERIVDFLQNLRIRNPLWKMEILVNCPPHRELRMYRGPLKLTSYQLSLYASRIAICKSRF
jgi:hypothetical protein